MSNADNQYSTHPRNPSKKNDKIIVLTSDEAINFCSEEIENLGDLLWHPEVIKRIEMWPQQHPENLAWNSAPLIVGENTLKKQNYERLYR